ncbi:MAG: hypothetical protein ACXVB9_17710 [Bdellovibrionota bacterium]
MKHFIFACLVLCAPLAARADVDDTMLSPKDAVSLCESWNYKAGMGSAFFHKAEAASEACHYHLDKAQVSKNAMDFCKTAHAQGVVELVFVRCLDAFPTGLFSKKLITFCDKTFYGWNNDESNPKPVPEFHDCLVKMAGKDLPDETLQAMTDCQKIKKGWGVSEGTDGYTVWYTKINRCLDSAMSHHVDTSSGADTSDAAHSSAQ